MWFLFETRVIADVINQDENPALMLESDRWTVNLIRFSSYKKRRESQM